MKKGMMVKCFLNEEWTDLEDHGRVMECMNDAWSDGEVDSELKQVWAALKFLHLAKKLEKARQNDQTTQPTTEPLAVGSRMLHLSGSDPSEVKCEGMGCCGG
jgi:hypothetical protein